MKLKQNFALRFIRLKFKIISFFSKKKAAQLAFRLFCTPLTRSINKAPSSFFENAENLSFSLEGLTIRGWRWNHPGNKKALILHGFSSAAHKFIFYAEALAGKNYEVLAFDAPAHGLSDGKTVNAVLYSEMIQKAALLYGPFDAYIAHSFGGMALSLSLENMPHNENTKVVMIAPATETTTALDLALNMIHMNSPENRKEIDKLILSISGKPTEWFSIKRAMHNIKASVLWIHDEDDHTTPITDAIKVQEENLPNLEFIFTKGLGHRKIYHDANTRKSVIDFL